MSDTQALCDDSGGVESEFEGAFDNYTTNAQDPHENLVAIVVDAGCGFQGVEPMGNCLRTTCTLRVGMGVFIFSTYKICST